MRKTNSSCRKTLAAAIAAGLVCLSAWVFAGGDTVTVHPELDEQQKLIACADCHRENTPDIHEQWFDSVHGLSMVKCYQCHGTFENFRVTPQVENCATCHVAMTEESHSRNKVCWECHTPHLFKAE